MACASYKVRVPGSLMLFGEHAVLYRKQAVVAAVNRYIEVSLIPRTDCNIRIESSDFGGYSVALSKFKIIKPYEYVLTAIQQYLANIKQGFTLKIISDFMGTSGLGSSAAVTVATLGVLTWWLNRKKPELLKLCCQAISVVRLVQGSGSGSDIAASIFGGVIAYRMQPLTVKKLCKDLSLVAVYSGSKITTSEVIAQVEQKREQFPQIFTSLYDTIDYCTQAGIAAIKNNRWRHLGKLMNIHQGLHEALGVNNAILAELVFSLRHYPNIYGAKISGSGLGDCVIGLGKIGKNSFPENTAQKKKGVKQIDIKVSPQGLVYL